MAAKRILITGGNGNLGQYLNIELNATHSILTVYRDNPGNCAEFNSCRGDITDFKFLEKIFADFKPEIVIHTAAVSNPALADKLDTATVFRTNVEATEKIAALCVQYNAKIIYTSTDLVYAGYRASLLHENARLAPMSLYAETKLMGEVKVQKSGADFVILRTALMYGAGLYHRTCFFEDMIQSLRDGKRVSLFTDQYRSPLALRTAAKIIAQIISINPENAILNFGGPTRISRMALGELVCKTGGFNSKLINPISLQDMPNVPAVEDVSLDISKLTSLGITLPSLEESIAQEMDIIIHKK